MSTGTIRAAKAARDASIETLAIIHHNDSRWQRLHRLQVITVTLQVITLTLTVIGLFA